MSTLLFQQILCAVDFSEGARHALETAVRLARSADGQIWVLYVSPRAAPVIGDIPYLTGPMPLPAEDLARVESELEAFVEPARRRGVRIHTQVVEGDAGTEIVRRASAHWTDLIVMGTHGRSGLTRLLLGSVAEDVLHHAPCPVVTVGTHSRPETWESPIRRILCAESLVRPSRALEYAVWLAEVAGADLVVMHAVEELPRIWEPGVVPFIYGPRLLDEAAIELHAALDEEWRRQHHVEDVVLPGRPHEAIVECARARAVDLVVLGVHERMPIDLPFMGSTTNKVVQTAECPVLTVRGEVVRSLAKIDVERGAVAH